MRVAFWFSLAVVVYIYAGYPLTVLLLARARPRRIARGDVTPSVTVLMSAYNEAAVLGRTLEHLVASDYPRERLQILAVSDGSTDGTDDIIRGFAPRGVTLLRQEPRNGKTAALNLAVRQATGDLLVFADANSLFDRGAVKALVRNFADPRVGYVTGKLTYLNPDGSMVGDGCTLYMKYENAIRRAESAIGSIVGVNGGIDAIRRALYVEMEPDELPDLALPLEVIERGYRVVYDPTALVREHALQDPADEYRMRVRVSLRALWTIAEFPHLFRIERFGLFAWQLFSHKVLRYLAFGFLIAVLVLSLGLARQWWVYALALAGQLFLLCLAALGWALDRLGGWRPRPLFVPYYFLLVNVAAAHAALKFLRGERFRMWQPRLG